MHICISPSQLGTQPLQVVNSAVALFHEKKRAFEKVFAIFNRDDHSTYKNATNKVEPLSSNGDLINDEGNQATFEAIVSVPCFELWLLLHYADIQSCFHRREILHRLRMHIANYEKGQNGLYKLTQGLLTVATERAEKLRSRFLRGGIREVSMHVMPKRRTRLMTLLAKLVQISPLERSDQGEPSPQLQRAR